MKYHIAVVKPKVILDLQSGIKKYESRISLVRHPSSRAKTGDKLFFKESGGFVKAYSFIKGALSFTGLTPAKVEELATRYSLPSEKWYWGSKSNARYCTIIELESVIMCDPFPLNVKLNGQPWITDCSIDYIPFSLR